MNLEQIQEMWGKDSVIDPDDLHTESLKIPQLHCKYYTLYNTVTLLREKEKENYNKVRLERYNYYKGNATDREYVEDPTISKKIRDKEMVQRYMDADEKLSKAELKIKYYDTMLNYLDSIIKNILNRTFMIKNAIEYLKFQSGV